MLASVWAGLPARGILRVSAVAGALPGPRSGQVRVGLTLDSWYDLHNPDASMTPLETTFDMVPGDFPPNLIDPQMRQITLLVMQANGASTPVTLDFLGFAPEGSVNFLGGPATTEANGLASTRRANGNAWLPILNGPRQLAGTWRIKFDSTHRDLFLNDRIEDVLLAISFEATVPL
jgi:hypothetical protein